MLAASCTVVLVVILLVFTYSPQVNLEWWRWAGMVTLMYLTVFFLAWRAIEFFVHGKIKLIYRSIHAMDAEDEGTETPVTDTDLSGVQKEVEEWAQDKRSEIKLLKEQAEFRRDFIGNLAHELKTPIFNMQGYLLTLMEGGLEDKKVNYDYLNKADKNLERLISLVEDLDKISRLEADSEELHFEKFNLVALVEEAYGLLELRAGEKEIDLRFNKKYERPVWVRADRGKILQVLSNLVANSIHYGKTGGTTETRFFDMDKHIMVEVADNGTGIGKEHLPRLFERFYRVDKSRARNQGGTGLGLAICKHIMDAHGQGISVKSAPGKGSTFTFTLEKAR